MIYLLWLSELALEVPGCILASRRQIKPLAIYLGFRALGDIAGMVALGLFGHDAYAWTDLIQRTIQYPLFWVLALYLVAKILHEDSRIAKIYLGMAWFVGIAAVIFFHFRPLTMAYLLRFEFVAQGIAAALVASAFGMAEMENWPKAELWVRLCGYAVIVHAGWDVLTTSGLTHGWRVEGLYPIGAITALLMWAWACSKVSCGGVEGHALPGGAAALCTNVPPSRFQNREHPQSEYQASPAGIEASSEVEGLALFSNHDFELLRKWRIRA